MNLISGSRPSPKKLGAQEPFSPAWPATKGAVQCKKKTGLSSHQAQLDKSVEELKSFEGKVLNCDRVTNNMAEEIRRIGLNFEDAEKRVHGVEAMVESHKASFSELINRLHNLEHPAVSSTSTGEVEEAMVSATEVRRIAANLESTSAQVARLTGRIHHWETMPKPELAKVEALELKVRLLMTRLEQSERAVHALREEIRTRPHGDPPKGMRPGSHVIGEMQRSLVSVENKYQKFKHAGTPSVNPVGIPIRKPEPRVQFFGVRVREARVAGSLPGFGLPPAEDDWSSMRSDDRGFRGRAPRGGRSGTRTHEGHGPPGMGGDWRHCAGLDRYFEADGDGWFMPRGWCFNWSTDKNLSRMGLGLRSKSRQEFYGQWRLMKFALNDLWTPRSTGKSHNLKDRIRG